MDFAHVFVHEVEIAAYRFYSTIPGLEGIPIDVPGFTMLLGTGALAGIPSLIVEPGLVRQEAFPSGRTPGVVAPSYGEVVYNNVDGRFETTLLGVPTDGAKITCRRGPANGAYPADFVIDYIAYVDGLPRFTKKRCTLRLRDRGIVFNSPVSKQAFDYGLSDATQGRHRPIVHGAPGLPGAILYMPFGVEQGNTWFLQANEPLDLDDVYDGGVKLIEQGEASSLADLYASEPNPSSYRWVFDDGSGFAEDRGTWIRLGSKVRVDLRYRANSPTITISELAIDAGIADADTMAEGSIDLDVGSRVIENQTYRDVLNDVARANVSILGLNLADEFFQRYIVNLDSEDYDTEVVLRDGYASIDWEVYPMHGMDRRVWQVRVNAGATQKGQLAGIPDLDGGAAEALSREHWLTTFTASVPELHDDDPSAEVMDLDIEANHFVGDTDAMKAFATKLLGLFGGIQVWTWLTERYTDETASLQLMDRVTLQSNRMTAGKKGRVVSIERQLAAGWIRFGVWTHYSTIPETIVELTSVDDASGASAGSATSRGSRDVRQPEASVIACSDGVTPLEVGLVKTVASWPEDCRLVSIEAALAEAQASGSTFTVDVHVDGATALSTLVTIDNGETSSATAATPPVLDITDIPQGARVEIYVTQVGDGTAIGLDVTLVVLP